MLHCTPKNEYPLQYFGFPIQVSKSLDAYIWDSANLTSFYQVIDEFAPKYWRVWLDVQTMTKEESLWNCLYLFYNAQLYD